MRNVDGVCADSLRMAPSLRRDRLMRLCADAGQILITVDQIVRSSRMVPLPASVKPWSDQFGSIQISVDPAPRVTIAPHFLDHNRGCRDLDHKSSGRY